MVPTPPSGNKPEAFRSLSFFLPAAIAACCIKIFSRFCHATSLSLVAAEQLPGPLLRARPLAENFEEKINETGPNHQAKQTHSIGSAPQADEKDHARNSEGQVIADIRTGFTCSTRESSRNWYACTCGGERYQIRCRQWWAPAIGFSSRLLTKGASGSAVILLGGFAILRCAPRRGDQLSRFDLPRQYGLVSL
jgi:hypothetical protein